MARAWSRVPVMIWCRRLLIAWVLIALVALLGACTPGQVAKGAASAALGAGGPNVAANVQAGQTNAQTVGTTRTSDQVVRDVSAGTVRQSADQNRVAADRVETVVVNEISTWVLIALVLGWILPSPGQIAQSLARKLGWA